MSLGTTKLSVYICLSWSGIIPFGFRTEFNLNEIADTNHITGFVDSSFETAESQYRNRKFNGSTVPAESCRVTITAGPGPQILVDLFFSLLSGHEGAVLELEDKARFPHCACFISVYHLHLHIVNTS